MVEMSPEELFDQAGPDQDDEEARQVKTLIRCLLQYDPAKRPSSADILSILQPSIQTQWPARQDGGPQG